MKFLAILALLINSVAFGSVEVTGIGSVTSVSGTSPVAVANGTTTPVISMPAASGSQNGYLTSANWTTFNNKGNGTVTNVTGTAPVSVATGTTTPVVSMTQADATHDGYLVQADWNTFNSKQTALGFTPVNADEGSNVQGPLNFANGTENELISIESSASYDAQGANATDIYLHSSVQNPNRWRSIWIEPTISGMTNHSQDIVLGSTIAGIDGDFAGVESGSSVTEQTNGNVYSIKSVPVVGDTTGNVFGVYVKPETSDVDGSTYGIQIDMSTSTATGSVIGLDVKGKTKLGTAGVAFTSMGACTVTAVTPDTTAADFTCTGVPASAATAVNCAGAEAFSTATGNALYCRATGTLNQIACETVLANTEEMDLTCMWVKP